jgi:hypothetical protein
MEYLHLTLCKDIQPARGKTTEFLQSLLPHATHRLLKTEIEVRFDETKPD